MSLTVVAIGALLAGCGQDESDSPKASGVPIPGVIATPDLPGRMSPAVVSADAGHLFVFGGQQPTATVEDRIVWLDDGALVDTRSGKTEALPDPPFNPPLSDPVASRSTTRSLSSVTGAPPTRRQTRTKTCAGRARTRRPASTWPRRSGARSRCRAT